MLASADGHGADRLLPATLRLGAVHLTVTDLERSLRWYGSALGLQPRRRDRPEAELGNGAATVVHLHADVDARPAGRHAGLYHYALLFPSREELARAVLRVAHVHLHVGDIDEALAFYCGVLGFELQANLRTAAFVSAGEYHHHVGLNVWKGRGVGPLPPHTVGLRQWSVQLPSEADVVDVRRRLEAAGAAADGVAGGVRTRDPWQIAVDFVCG